MFQYKHRYLEITSIIIFVAYCIMLVVKIGEETIRLTANLDYLILPLAILPLFVGYIVQTFFPDLCISWVILLAPKKLQFSDNLL
jgi:hypothetical protein